MPAREVRWGMLATGGIVQTFTKDLLIDPTTRNVCDIRHVVTAVASSSSIDAARSFIEDFIDGKQKSATCTAYGSYEELVKDENVDIIYVGTPHSHHYQNCRLALRNGKPVLCEKALTVNAQQAEILIAEAKSRQLFFMEAVWTRYLPLSISVREDIRSAKVGEIVRVSADLSLGETPEVEYPDPSNRMLNLDLAGGVLLDWGIYALNWLFQTVYHTLPPGKRTAPVVAGAAMEKELRTGADESDTILLTFPTSSPHGKRSTHAVATCAMRTHFDFRRDDPAQATPAVRIFGEDGEIQVMGPIFRPSRYKIIYRDPGVESEVHDFDFPGGIHGMAWEADEAARCLIAGKLESDTMPWTESLDIMQVMDEVRRLGGLRYPDAVESTDWPVEIGKRDPGKHVQTKNRT